MNRMTTTWGCYSMAPRRLGQAVLTLGCCDSWKWAGAWFCYEINGADDAVTRTEDTRGRLVVCSSGPLLSAQPGCVLGRHALRCNKTSSWAPERCAIHLERMTP